MKHLEHGKGAYQDSEEYIVFFPQQLCDGLYTVNNWF